MLSPFRRRNGSTPLRQSALWSSIEKAAGYLEVESKSLGDLGAFFRGSGIQKADFTEAGAGCIHYSQIHTHYSTWATKTKPFIDPEFASRVPFIAADQANEAAMPLEHGRDASDSAIELLPLPRAIASRHSSLGFSFRGSVGIDRPSAFTGCQGTMKFYLLFFLEVSMTTVEERLAKVERDLEAIKREKLAENAKLGWLERVRGTFKGDPDFEEIVRLGKELRDKEATEGNQ